MKDGKVREKKILKMTKYIGESARSCFERGSEHLDDMVHLRTSSHLLKHYLTSHEGEDINNITFRMKAVKFHRSAFERQIHESVRIQSSRGIHDLMNSKSEYNRCALPRLGLKWGDREFKEKKDEEEHEASLEEELEKKIRQMRKNKNKDWQKYQQKYQPQSKRRKNCENEGENMQHQERQENFSGKRKCDEEAEIVNSTPGKQKKKKQGKVNSSEVKLS